MPFFIAKRKFFRVCEKFSFFNGARSRFCKVVHISCCGGCKNATEGILEVFSWRSVFCDEKSPLFFAFLALFAIEFVAQEAVSGSGGFGSGGCYFPAGFDFRVLSVHGVFIGFGRLLDDVPVGGGDNPSQRPFVSGFQAFPGSPDGLLAFVSDVISDAACDFHAQRSALGVGLPGGVHDLISTSHKGGTHSTTCFNLPFLITVV